ncbi:MAG: DUF255 domain-containing protein [Pirellulales bacterium]|nr:DUF255 domain-containing protein [Pirellulales bacterium]
MRSATATLVGVSFFVCAFHRLWPVSDVREINESVAPAAQSDREEPMFENELIKQTSPYLLQHAHNPVNWMPWAEAAFEKARREDKPIFLSVGYSTCHWCHVMGHESFENEEVATILNEHFVSIKVDREELPDVDAQYMLATQLITRQSGGWPNSVWLTHDRRPWFAGTYFPREDRGRQAGFKTLLLHLAQVWKTQRSDVEEQARHVADAIRHAASGTFDPQDDRPLGRDLIDNAEQILSEQYDPRHGGFGNRPKFPPHGVLSLLISQQRRSPQQRRLGVIVNTLVAMNRGGIYDHVGGGFHRYATDERWLLPHFEKMLYDNAQLIHVYADAYELTGREEFGRVIAETFAWLTREMTDPGGGFYSALDADSLNEDGHTEEGKFYVWTPAEIIDTLDETDAKLFIEIYGIAEGGNFRDEATGRRTGNSIPFLAGSLSVAAEHVQLDEKELFRRLKKIHGKLLTQREKRPRPHLDDKVLTAWNGLMIMGLAHAGRVLNEPPYIEAAARAADFVLENLREEDGRLLRTWRRGKAKLPAYLNDYAFFIAGLLELHRAMGQDRWLRHADAMTELMIRDFGNDESGGFFLTSDKHDTLLFRGTGLGGGGNIPSGGGVATQVLVRLSVLTGNKTYADVAAKALVARKSSMWRQPYQAEHFIIALGEYLDMAEEGKLPPLESPKTMARDESVAADASVSEPPLHLRAFAARDRVAPGEVLRVAVQIEIDKPWHIYSDRPGSDIPIKTLLTLESPNATLESVHYPKGKPLADPNDGETLYTFSGKVTLTAVIRINANAQGPVALNFKLRAQACDERQCLQPRTYELPIEVLVAGDPVPAAKVASPSK